MVNMNFGRCKSVNNLAGSSDLVHLDAHNIL